ncbi:LuxR C-terminal-related transcriptional regulator [Kitasatospora sp. NPDC059571]|uniref:LuxR C-terminal-related transcriptional regulator n=1 Tax=Kitasatospora sp. NPDC059571 TaxID=3346871 RepID=UPI00369438BB
MPDDEASRLYLEILAEGGRIPQSAVPPDRRASIDLLLDVGLVMPNHLDGWYTAVSPRAVAERFSAEMRTEATRLLLRAEGLPAELDALTRAYEALPRRSDRPGEAAYVDGNEAIRHRIAQLVSESEREILSTQPGSRPAPALALARTQDLLLLERGGTLRTLYQPITLGEPMAVDYATTVTSHGGAVRVLDEPFQRMIIIDRSVAVVPVAADAGRAAFITDPATLSFLVAGFERDWLRADVVQWHEITAPAAPATAADRVGRLLAQGLTQRAVASRLGLSERTVAGHISRLRDRYGAQTLFQLGWLMRGSRSD